MRELRLTDAELQALVSPALHDRFKSAGFHTAERDALHFSVALPVRINLAGIVTVERGEDGVWVFRQELDQTISDRTADACISHHLAVEAVRQ